MAAIQTEGLTKRYGRDGYAINDLSLTVEEGEVFGFIGPNGAGKSTTIDALVAAYLAIGGERESGSLRLLLALEPNRRRVVLGKFVGRSAVVVAGLGIGFLLASVATWLVYGALPVVPFLAVLALTVGLGVVFVGLAIGVRLFEPEALLTGGS